MQSKVDFELIYSTHSCFFGFGFGRKKEDGVRPSQLPVLAEHAFAALWSTETPSVSSTGILPVGEMWGSLGRRSALPHEL